MRIKMHILNHIGMILLDLCMCSHTYYVRIMYICHNLIKPYIQLCTSIYTWIYAHVARQHVWVCIGYAQECMMCYVSNVDDIWRTRRCDMEDKTPTITLLSNSFGCSQESFPSLQLLSKLSEIPFNLWVDLGLESSSRRRHKKGGEGQSR